MPDLVGRSERSSQVPKEYFLEAFARRPQCALWAILVLGLGKLLGREVKSFIPGSRTPISFSPASHADKRSLQAGGTVHLLQPSIAAGAQHTPRLGIFRVGIQFVNGAVFDDRDHGALVHTRLARGGHLQSSRFFLRRVAEGLHVSQRGTNGGSCRASGRKPQKLTPIHIHPTFRMWSCSR